MIRRRRRSAKEGRAKPARPSPHRLVPPEGVPITLAVAPLGTRAAAQMTDIVVTLIGAIALVVLASLANWVSAETVFALGALLFFLTRVPYYTLSELGWNGQTLGKRLMGVKVIADDGGPLTTHALVTRNLMKEAEIFLPATLVLTLDSSAPVATLIAFVWILGTLLVPLTNPRRQRLGDMMAGTYVISLPVPILLADVSQAAPTQARSEAAKGHRFFAHQLDHYGVYELQTLEGVLRASDRTAAGTPAGTAAGGAPIDPETLSAVVERIRAKIDYPHPVPRAEQLDFLKAFYKAQRAHLEQRQLLGERREDKFHAQSDGPED